MIPYLNQKVVSNIRSLCHLTLICVVLLTGCKNGSVFTQWYAFPPEAEVYSKDWLMLAGVSKQIAPVYSLDVESGMLIMISITSPNGEELTRRQVIFPGIDDVEFIGQWQSATKFSVDVFEESSDPSHAVGRFIASLEIEL